jgi:signal transduction histidine kinase
MNYIFKLAFFGYIIAGLAITSNIEYMEVVALLLIAAASLYREKFGSYIILFVIEGAAISYGTTLEPSFSLMFGIMAYDLISSKYYIGVIPPVLVGFYLLESQELINFLFIVSLSCIFAYTKGILQSKEALYRSSFDKQREYSYQLEQAKARLMTSAEEAAHMAEIKERNRIARQIHDNVGHSIAGILMQLQAAKKLYNKDADKADQLLGNSVEALADTLTIMRDTVHNIKPQEKLGIEYIRQVIENYSFCTVEMSTTGDFSELSVNIMQILHSNIKEALTNVSKFSNATKVDINIDVNYKFVRLKIKDNGLSSEKFKEGFGISGMKERVRNIGGTIAFSNDNGFLIVCVLPIKNTLEVTV